VIAAASAPARVDLAGGTLDLWPISVLCDGACTVNLAVDRRARAKVQTIASGFEIVSRDRDVGRTYGSARDAVADPAARLAAEAALSLGFESGLRIETESAVPFGSGLGGSSALLVALIGALGRLAGREFPADEMVDWCRDVETRVLGVPAGMQDYQSAIRGGINVIEHGPGRPRVRTQRAPAVFASHCVLFDTGAPHHSGTNNWEITKRYLDGDRSVADAVAGVRDAARAMARAVESEDLPAMGRALAAEWQARTRLSPAVSTPLLVEADRAAHDAGAWGAKACGAGGGGVMIVLAPAARRDVVVAALSELPGGRIFEALPEVEGLRFEI
jgi:D-glycero-alpha-D-manno-heptose-7-phosphate kinase